MKLLRIGLLHLRNSRIEHSILQVNHMLVFINFIIGMYIPYTAKAIVEGNTDSSLKISLRGILIGNGLLVSDGAKRSYAL